MAPRDNPLEMLVITQSKSRADLIALLSTDEDRIILSRVSLSYDSLDAYLLWLGARLENPESVATWIISLQGLGSIRDIRLSEVLNLYLSRLHWKARVSVISRLNLDLGS